MLVGRDRERALLHGLVAGARVGQGAALVLVGEAGIGKSVLLADADEVASASGMQVLRATGTASETGIGFGALSQVLRPVLGHLDRIPAPQAAALAAALALRPGPAGDRFAVGAATLSLLSRAAEDAPLAAIVDDAHLLDQPSAQALAFAARRLSADPVVLLAAVRDGEPCALTEAGLPVLAVAGVPLEAVPPLLGAAGSRLAGDVVARLHAATGGNPLALAELGAGGLGLEALLPAAPVPVPASLARAFALRADRLSGPARTALLVAATAGGDLAPVDRACRALGTSAAALEEAEAAGLLTMSGGGPAFRHGLVRSAVYTEATPGQRRAVHRALAAALAGRDGDGDGDGDGNGDGNGSDGNGGDAAADRRAWHLAEAALGPDEQAAAALAAAAARARERSAYAVAADAAERAARLSPDPADRAERLVVAAESAEQAGTAGSAAALLAAVDGLPLSPALRIRIAALRGTVATRTGAVEEARDVLLAAGDEATATDPDAAVLLLADAVLACFLLGDTATLAAAAARLDRLLGTVGPTAEWVATMATGVAGVLTGRGGADRIRRALLAATPDGALPRDPRLAPLLVLGPLFLRERATGRDVVPAVVEELRRRTDIGRLPLLLFLVARDCATTDAWAEAEVAYAEGIALAREAGQVADLAICLAGLAWLEARQGRDAACRAHAEEARSICTQRHLGVFTAWSLWALGELELGAGRTAAAVDALERLRALLVEQGVDDVDLSPVPELVEALVGAGRPEAAAALVPDHSARAARKGQPWAMARAARAAGLVADDADLDGRFGEALALHARTPDVFETARTQLAFGARLRRARRRADARGPLGDALAAFESLGAGPWADRAAAELRATGATAARRAASPLQALTPQEQQIARLLASGRTTKQAAAALFLSPKTVEYHLRHVYLKLGVGSRAELAERLGGSG
ncbi:helix-turn-helix transcriptional regulator [Trujillonella endophytica]|uniref:Regulatory protein, luxR family n=1 Tax=Trujillonella endophytica TaxID=673521 RepID=A0A1H8PZS6_9ACTN|nr:LuxR family transcriptional regulator [Trujillella endophytica]SEO47495.1 regulatory protein, luxR family [Trujillella endophytica]